MRKYLMEAYGCQMNVAESNAIETVLKARGWESTPDPEQADAVVINTCSVRQSAENRIWGRLGNFSHIKSKKPLVIVLTGCMASRVPEELKKKAPYIDCVVSTNDKAYIADYLDSSVTPEGCVTDRKNRIALPGSEKYIFPETYYREGDITAYVPIMNGCDNFCAYCIVPYVRGREVSRPVCEILSEIRMLDAKGVREIQLLGQNVNSYNYEGTTFAMLLRLVCREIHNIKWVRFDSPHPKDFKDELIEVLASENRVARHYHIPLQSGSNRILGLMNRRYTKERFMQIVDKIKKAVPDATFSTDVMVGFPSETEEEAQETRKTMEEIGLTEAFMYYWNPREGTRAFTMEGQLPETEKIARLQKIIDFQLQNCAKIKQKRVGQVCDVIVTQVSRDNENEVLGRNEHNESIAFPNTRNLKVGDIVTVRCTALKGNTFRGEIAG